MTRAAVETGFERFVDRMVDVAYREFDVVGALRGGRSGPGSRVVNKLLKNNRRLQRSVIRPEFREFQRRALAQFQPVLDFAADGATDIEPYRAAIIDRDPFLRNLKRDLPGGRRETLNERVLARNRRLGEVVVPLVDSEHGEFWAAVRAELSEERARELVEEAFSFTGPVRDHRDAFAFEVDIDPSDVGGILMAGLPTVTVDFTDEAIRVMRHAEEEVIERAKGELDGHY